MTIKLFECLTCGCEFSFVNGTVERDTPICPHCFKKNLRRIKSIGE